MADKAGKLPAGFKLILLTAGLNRRFFPISTTSTRYYLYLKSESACETNLEARSLLVVKL